MRGTLGNRRRVGRVGRRVDSARRERMRATSGKSLYIAPFYTKLGLVLDPMGLKDPNLGTIWLNLIESGTC